ncbi:reverse transcriptase domain-containing protein [Tanacetum coccineum]
MDDNRTMAQMLKAHTVGYEDAIVVPEITTDNFELNTSLLHEVPERPDTSIKRILFLISLKCAGPNFGLLKKNPSIDLTWDNLVSKFINKFFPPSKTTNLQNEITRFQQRFDETFYEAWDRFNDLLRACPHYGFSELHQLDTFYNALTANFVNSNTASTSGLGTLPSNTITNPEGEVTLRVGKEAITFNLDKTLRYSSNYDEITANRIDVIELACEEYSQEVLGFFDVIVCGNPTPYMTRSFLPLLPLSLPLGIVIFFLRKSMLSSRLEHESNFNEVDDVFNYDLGGDILRSPSLVESKTDKSSIDEPLEIELKDLPPHLEYVFLEGDNKLPVIISKDLSVEEKAALIKVLKSLKQSLLETL